MSESPADQPTSDLHHLDDLNIHSIILWGVLSVAITLIAVFSLHALYNWYDAEQRVEKSESDRYRYRVAADLLDKQRSSLVAVPHWVDKENDIVAVPIDLAKQLILKEYASTK